MKESWKDYELLDHPALASLIFYPRPDYFMPSAPGRSIRIDVPVENHINISCQFYFQEKDSPNILFFHGNGELASEYEEAGAIFNEAGINLFVADYRGYGRSSGRPSVSSMIKDAHGVLAGFKNILGDKGFKGSRFIMGRSLGSASAIELAASYPDEFRGLVIESGFCDITDLIGRLGLLSRQSKVKLPSSPGLERVKNISMPALVIHGEYDSIVPLMEGERVYRNLGSVDKRLVVIPGADHNSIMAVGMELYMKELTGFIGRNK